MDWKSAWLELPCYCITTEKRDFIFCTTCRTVSQHGGCNPTANETRLLLWHCEAPDKKHFTSKIGHVYQIWFPVEKWKCHMKVPSRKLWFRKVTLRPFFKEWVLGHVYNRGIKWLAAANCIKKIQESRGYVRTHRLTKLNSQRTPEMATKKFAATSRGHSL